MVPQEIHFDQVTAHAPTFGNDRAITNYIFLTPFSTNMLFYMIVFFVVRVKNLNASEHPLVKGEIQTLFSVLSLQLKIFKVTQTSFSY